MSSSPPSASGPSDWIPTLDVVSVATIDPVDPWPMRRIDVVPEDDTPDATPEIVPRLRRSTFCSATASPAGV